MPKIIAHIDIDTFFVSSEIRLDPTLQGQPIAISRKEDFAMAVSISKEVKEKGFKITDKTINIKKKIPNLVVIEPNLAYYRFLSRQFFDFITKNFTKKIEIYSIDECFLDLSDYLNKFNTIYQMLYYIKKKLQKELKLPISIGVSHNKLLAKMATNLAKHTPEKITVIPRNKIKPLIYSQKIEKLFGIGIVTAQKLKNIGIFTINDLVKAGVDNEKIIQVLGVQRHELFQSLTSTGDDIVVNKPENFKSVSHFRTFSHCDTLTKTETLLLISEFLPSLVAKLDQFNKGANRVEIYFKLKNKEQNRFFTDLSQPSNNYDLLYNNLVALANKIDDFSLLLGFGICLSKISDYDKSMLNTNQKVKNIIASVNKKIGSKKLVVLKSFKN
ncbi:DNA polymerase IV [Mesomycoplasma ovipneumoniae]